MGANRFLEPGSASARLFEDARQLIPGGTSKANFDVRPHPFYLVSGRGCRVIDADGVLIGANGLGCLSTPVGEREVDEIAEAAARSLLALAREA